METMPRPAFTLGRSDRVDARLRGRALTDHTLSAVASRLPESQELLARDQRGPVWTVEAAPNVDAALVSPAELQPGVALRSHLRAGRSLALLPLIHLLRRVTGYDRWIRPGPRAAFLFDDPNLHWRSYGHIRFAELATSARHHRYHAAMGTVPLDAWFAHRGAVRTFAEARESLSLTLHGNDHEFEEFGRTLNPAAAAAVLAQACGGCGGLRPVPDCMSTV